MYITITIICCSYQRYAYEILKLKIPELYENIVSGENNPDIQRTLAHIVASYVIKIRLSKWLEKKWHIHLDCITTTLF